VCYRYHQLAIERPKLAATEAWYGRLQERAPFRTHVMLPLT
jgi:glutathione S-transferase